MNDRSNQDPVSGANAVSDGAPSRRQTLFATRLWFRHWLEAFGRPESGWWRPRAKDAASFEIPYVIERRRVGPLHLRVAAAAANSHTPRFDAAGHGAPSAADFHSMMRDLRVDALVFPYVAANATLALALERANPMLWHRDFCEAAPYIDCTGDWDDYLESRGKSRRTAWLYDERRAQKIGYTYDHLVRWSDIEANLDEVLAVEVSGWKGKIGGAISQDTVVTRFYKALCRELADNALLHLFLLRQHGVIVAFQICSLYAGTLSCLKIGYLEEHAKFAPGRVLQFHIVQWAFSRADIAVFDMLGPSSDTKIKWSTGVDELSTFFVFRPSIGGALAKLRWDLAAKAKSWVRGHLPARRDLPNPATAKADSPAR